MDDVDTKLNAFLNQHFARCVDKVERLEGGLINYTFRLHLKEEFPSLSLGSSNDHSVLLTLHRCKPRSLITKIAYEYVAAIGEAAPLPLIRQQIEERALKLFNKSPLSTNDTESKSIDLSSVLHRNRTIQTGRVWLRDKINNILIMDDHGALPAMDKWFMFEKSSSLTESNVILAQTYGQQLASFIVDMQISSLPSIDQLELLLHNPGLKQRDLEETSAMIKNTCAIYDIHDVDKISSVFIQYFEHDISRAATDGQVLAHGDLWAPNFLIDERNSTLALIDWEWAGVRSPALDPALLLARYRIHMLTNPINESMIRFTNAFIDAYREGAKKHEVSWYKNEHEQYLFAWYLSILYGTTVMYWSLFQTCCPDKNGICSHRRDIVVTGADYLRRCQSGPDKVTYDSILTDPFLGRLFQVPN